MRYNTLAALRRMPLAFERRLAVLARVGLFSLSLLASLLMPFAARSASEYVNANNILPPGVEREFRGAWVATVNNIDWPSKPNLPVKQQQDELLTILDRAVTLHLNAIILQVRPGCDAFYDSKFEPWSYYLTGETGRAPEPFYDPLAFAVAEAHKRGLELHAWFNPYRAALLNPKIILGASHISHTHPDWVRKYGDKLWLDPGEKKVQDYSLRVIMDVVKRYDIDGVHFDDYFYPYKEKDAQGRDLDFPDEETWRKYGMGHHISRDDWRRDNVNTFVRRVYESIKDAKPWVKFGISPFGIWQPGFPPQIKGFNSYAVLYGDSRKWLESGWVDYLAPQLYWAIAPPDQSFPVLLKWWEQQNPKHRNIWPGLDAERVGTKWKASEILNQVQITREDSRGSGGEIYWSVKTLMQDRGGLASALASGPYAQPALVPASSWLEWKPPSKPKIKMDGANLYWQPPSSEKISVWLLQTKTAGQWHTEILPGPERQHSLASASDIVALTAIDRCGVAGSSAVLQRSTTAAAK